MADIQCSRCGNLARVHFAPAAGQRGYFLEIKGIVGCENDGHGWPLTIRSTQDGGIIRETATALPINESSKLNLATTPLGLIQDVEEAERSHFANCYKASVVLCRRALQLALEDKGCVGRTLGPLLADARAKAKPLLSVRADAMAEGIKDYGDTGAHRKDDIDGDAARQVIFVTAMVLRELYP